ncbi:MAG: hypothetical protein E7410_07550 [Ruminococcaceae bacterium]|nr:hypothetical protein [Oscillospiraceae bacterium]
MITETDRFYIERKYHDPDKEFNAFSRMAYHGIGYIEESGLDDAEILKGLEELSSKTEQLPHPIARAMAIKYVLENERLYINEHDYFVGLYSLNRLANITTFKKWENESKAYRAPETLERADDFNRSGAVMIWTDYDHVVPDWKSLLELGFSGIRERAREYQKLHKKNGTLNDEMSAFFDGIEIEYTAIIEFIDRMHREALKQTFEKSSKIAECLKNLRDGAPVTFYEALQLIYIYFIISESIDSYQVRSLGNGLDHTLYGFYKNDIESGIYTKEDIRNYLSYFLMQWSAIGNYWGQPFYMGGTNLEGSTKYNELSYMILDVYDKLEIYNPKIQLKINTNTPDHILNKAFDMVRRKNASIVFCCEPAMIKAIMGYGATYEEALNYDIRGCYETGVRANEVSSTSGYVNAAKALEFVFTNGFDAVTNKQVGIKTGEISEMKTFEDFYFAFLKQWEYLIEQSMKITNDAERFLAFVNPSSMYSATIETSLKNGRDGYGGGVKFNNNAMLNCGFASAVDSLLTVKEFVFDKKEITLAELSEVLRNNWEGYEILRAKVKKSPHKYGNNDMVADTYASAMSSYFANKVNNVPNSRGGVYKAIFHSARAFVIQGEKTGALPDGRLAGEELSKNASAVPGMDKKGVTALVESATKLIPSDYHESFNVDVMLHPSTVDGENGYNVFKGILMTYLKKGGQSIQFNIFNIETLRDAQKNPEKYKNLQVRVCGWNTLWNNMSKKEQDAYILRAENIQ